MLPANTGKVTPAVTAPMANAYANAATPKKLENLIATFDFSKQQIGYATHRCTSFDKKPGQSHEPVAIWQPAEYATRSPYGRPVDQSIRSPYGDRPVNRTGRRMTTGTIPSQLAICRAGNSFLTLLF
ncbi:hypothetical protein F2Q70_00039120 [Brassica cretica]|uniref:Uncharacterized protein n=1 Tax=Brassica cretica TaxID=69181 RepID=A0A8S9K477_BRACR|nr:hypothetical protein F2Q70_00039120 [Brassica cretica]